MAIGYQAFCRLAGIVFYCQDLADSCCLAAVNSPNEPATKQECLQQAQTDANGDRLPNNKPL
jgi:hypothetical protein